MTTKPTGEELPEDISQINETSEENSDETTTQLIDAGNESVNESTTKSKRQSVPRIICNVPESMLGRLEKAGKKNRLTQMVLFGQAIEEFKQWFYSDLRHPDWKAKSTHRHTKSFRVNVNPSYKEYLLTLAFDMGMTPLTLYFNALEYWLSKHGNKVRPSTDALSSCKFYLSKEQSYLYQLILDKGVVISRDDFNIESIEFFLSQQLRLEKPSTFRFVARPMSSDGLNESSPDSLASIGKDPLVEINVVLVGKSKHAFVQYFADLYNISLRTVYYNLTANYLEYLKEKYRTHLGLDRAEMDVQIFVYHEQSMVLRTFRMLKQVPETKLFLKDAINYFAMIQEPSDESTKPDYTYRLRPILSGSGTRGTSSEVIEVPSSRGLECISTSISLEQMAAIKYFADRDSKHPDSVIYNVFTEYLNHLLKQSENQL